MLQVYVVADCNMYTHATVYAHVHSCTPMYTHVHPCTLIHTRVHPCTLMYTHAHSCTPMYTHHRRIWGGARGGNAPPTSPFAPPSPYYNEVQKCPSQKL